MGASKTIRIFTILPGCMMGFLLRLCSTRVFPVTWTIIVIGLLSLPGSAIPGGGGLFEIEGLDKVVHIFFFGGFVLFWGFYRLQRISVANGMASWRLNILNITILSILLGIAMEYLQFYCIPRRSFDNGDIWANTAGSVAAGLFHIFFSYRRLKRS